MRVYSSYFSWEQALLKTKVNYYQSVSYSIVEPNGDYQHVKLCVGEAVETTLSADSQSAFGIIKGIIEHTWNDDQVYVFIYLDWLENLKNMIIYWVVLSIVSNTHAIIPGIEFIQFPSCPSHQMFHSSIIVRQDALHNNMIL